MHQAARTRALLPQAWRLSNRKAGGRTRRGTAGTIRAPGWRPASAHPQVGVEEAWSTQRMEQGPSDEVNELQPRCGRVAGIQVQEARQRGTLCGPIT